MFRILSFSMLAVLSLGVEPALAEKFWDSKYQSTEGTTMNVYFRGNANISISGRGRFSTYQASCRRSGEHGMSCSGTGIRTSDNKTYKATYDIATPDGGKSITSTWRAVYANGESFNGKTSLTMVSTTNVPGPAKPAPYRGDIAGTYQAEGSKETLRISNTESERFNVEIELGARGALVDGRWIDGQVGTGFRFKVDGAEFTGIYEPKSRLIFIRKAGKTVGSFRKK